jgi:hypothetical protein
MSMLREMGRWLLMGVVCGLGVVFAIGAATTALAWIV